MEINKGQPTVYDYVFPVFGGSLDENGLFFPKQIYGTAFYIDSNNFVTCAHTIENANENELTVLGFQNEINELAFARIKEQEIFSENDSAIIVANIPRAKSYPWLSTKLGMLNDVIRFGYPYGLDNLNFEILVRSFKGHIILVGFYNRFSKKPPHYELSYQCPRGLSGGPLIFIHENAAYICGMTIGNEITEIVVNSFKETNQIDNKIEIYHKTEALHRGIAMQSSSFFSINSKLLGDTFLNYLTKNKLLK